MNLPTWNLSEFYTSFKDKQINKDLGIEQNDG